MKPGDERPPSKAAKIWRRTLVGSSLAGVVFLAFYLAHANGTAWPVAVIGCGLACACAWELHGMGSWRGQGWLYVLIPPCLAGFGAVVRATLARESASAHGLSVYESFVQGTLASELVAALAVALVGHALVRGVGWESRLGKGVALAWTVGASLLLLRAARPDAAPLAEEPWLLVLAAASLVASLLGPARLRRNLGWTLVFCLWLCVGLPALGKVWHVWGLMGLAALVLLSKVGDIAGYYFGNAFGRHHPFKKLSPGKTIEGCAASLVAGTLCAWVLVQVGWLPSAGALSACAAGAVVNLAAQAGDLFESWIKRLGAVKDSGPWFGPSGGLLDLVDSLLFSVPAALCAWPLLLD